MSKHTPGPWEANFDAKPGQDIPIRVHLYCINGLSAWFELARVHTPDEQEIGYTDGHLSAEQTITNARLIAAAPDLLEALLPFAAALHAYTDGTYLDQPIDELKQISADDLRRAYKAFTKATGEA